METPKRILGIDYGSRRIGFSLSDPLGIIATPYETLRNDETIWKYIRAIVERESVGAFVIGMPVTLRGDKGKKAQEVDAFAERLRSEIGLDVFPWDERYSTSIARQTLLDMNTRKKSRNAKNGTLDSMAAAITLQSYLDSRKNSLSC